MLFLFYYFPVYWYLAIVCFSVFFVYILREVKRKYMLHTRYTPMNNSRIKIRNVSLATDEGHSPKLALSEGGSRENIES